MLRYFLAPSFCVVLIYRNIQETVASVAYLCLTSHFWEQAISSVIWNVFVPMYFIPIEEDLTNSDENITADSYRTENKFRHESEIEDTSVGHYLFKVMYNDMIPTSYLLPGAKEKVIL